MPPMNPSNQSAILSGSGYSPWQAPLAALFSGISAAGQPGGWSNFGAGVTQGAQNFQRGQAEQQMMQLRQQQIAQAEEEQRRANQEREQEQAKQEAYRNFFAQQPGSPTPVQPVGNYGAATGGIQTASGVPGQSAILGGMDPQQSALFSQYAQIDPEGAFQMLAERSFAEPEKLPGEVQEYEYAKSQGFKGSLLDWETQKAAAGRAPVQGDGSWERYVDPETGRMGQRNSKTGKIDWDPGNSMMAQVGTDAQGNPIFDFVSGAPGPTKEFESKLANQSLLMGQGIDEIERLVEEDKVSSARVAGSEQLAELGPLGEVLGQSVLLSPEDKQYMAARAAAMESLANTITGAAFTEQQKINFMNMLPRPTDDKATASKKLKQMRAYLKEIELNAKVSTRRDEQRGGGGTVIDGYTITPVD